jgi:transposase InsO family protein
VQTAECKLYLFVGIDRTSKFAVTQLVDKADRRTAWEFLEHLLKAVPYRIHTIPTDNGIQFAEQPRNRNSAWSRQLRFDMICEASYIEHRLTKPNHPWTNGQVERMDRTTKEATVKRFHYERHDQPKTHRSGSGGRCASPGLARQPHPGQPKRTLTSASIHQEAEAQAFHLLVSAQKKVAQIKCRSERGKDRLHHINGYSACARPHLTRANQRSNR